MTGDGRPGSQPRVPTLTEVIEVGVDSMLPADTVLPEGAEAADAPVRIDEAELVQRVLADVQRQIDLMLEYRLREALAPALARLSEALVHEVRDELASTLRDVVVRAVTQELSRHRAR
jgi:hypothetical protein